MTFADKFLSDRLDIVAISTIMLLITGIGLVVLMGDNIGVRIEEYSPNGLQRGNAPVQISFYEEMNRQSVEQRFSVSPSVEGSFRWSNNNRNLIFEPQTQWLSGQTYTVSIKKGAAAAQTSLKDDFSFTFEVAQPQVLYLYPSDALERNLYAYDLNTGQTQRLTEATFGISDFAVSADGSQIAYTQYNEDGTTDIWIYDVRGATIRQLTNCENACCGAPTWRPDGTQIAFERQEADATFGQVSARRVWVVDVATSRFSLLFEDTQIIGYSPRYSPDGSKIAMVLVNEPGILVYDLTTGGRFFIENPQGVVGDFSPDGTKIVYPIVTRGAMGSTFYNQLEMVDLTQNVRIRVTTPPEAPIADKGAVWNPDNKTLAIQRQYLDERYTPGTQIYLMDITTYEATPLIVDGNYTAGFMVWSMDGQWLAMQRFNMTAQNARPEIWVYSRATGELIKVVENGFLPGMIP